jgi:phospholipid/cholesterol/gamma-HCH transport system permease protein
VGTGTLARLEGARSFVTFLGEAALALARLPVGRARMRARDLWVLVQECGADAVGVVSLISLLVGLILALVGAVQLRMFGAEIYVANLVGIAMAREMGAMMTGILMAGRTGAAFAAQLGTMTVNEEVDALRTFGVPPMDFLVLPRLLALVMMMPLLCVYADLMGVIGGALVGIGLLDLSPAAYVRQTIEAVTLADVSQGVAKSVVYGAIVALASCHRGMSSGRSASSVGLATTSAVVTSIIAIIVADAVMVLMIDRLGW